MSKAVKLTNNNVLSTQDVVHKRGGGWYYLNNLLDNIYPIGSVFITTNTINPSTYFGGSWERIKGRFLLAADDSTYKIGATGGEATHVLTLDELASHEHGQVRGSYSSRVLTDRGDGGGGGLSVAYPSGVSTQSNCWRGNYMESRGGNKPHNNMPPYLVVYMWKRIS